MILIRTDHPYLRVKCHTYGGKVGDCDEDKVHEGGGEEREAEVVRRARTVCEEEREYDCK
jgi:hypothetical protein